ncbi:YsnF/AvaK domain-containing protein [Longimicrobium sp.]|uniref:YsnF/AvaK domain-containing protein n=1 Tax=Longimicrobium sp. TaxID=2029185 RepID=UPI003B3B00B9
MLERLGGDDRDDLRNDRMDNRDMAMSADRQRLVRERMEAHGVNEEEALRLVLNEEQLAVGKREVEAGSVGVHKTVETQHVHENVQLRHEEVEVERRPITDGYVAGGNAMIGEDEEIRMKLHAEEAVVEKRVVPTEELVVRKREVVENQPIDATLRREHAEVDREVRNDTHLRDSRLDDDRLGRP